MFINVSVASYALRPKRSNPARKGVRLNLGRDDRVRCSVWLGGGGVMSTIAPPAEKNDYPCGDARARQSREPRNLPMEPRVDDVRDGA